MLVSARAVMSPDVDRGTPAAVFAALDREGVRHVVWKDIASVSAFASGDSELDLYVPPADFERFEAIARAHGFASYRNIVDLYRGGVVHLIRIHDRRHFHLHVHRTLVTGDHYAKELCLDSLADDSWFTGPHVAAIRVVPPEVELRVGLVRLISKAATPEGLPAPERERLRALATEEALARAVTDIKRRLGTDTIDVALVRRALDDAPEARARLARAAGALAPLRRVGPGTARAMRWVAEGSNALLRRFGLANKVHAGPAPIIAIVGVDGSGKSTLARGLRDVFARKVSTRLEFLGGNDRTYSPWSWTTLRWSQVAGVARRAAGDPRALRDLHLVSLALFEHAKCHDRVRRIRRSAWLARRGIITVYERYPLKGLFDYPRLAREIERGEFDVDGVAGWIVQRLLASIDEALTSAAAPDAIVLVRVPYQQIAERRVLQAGERRDIDAKFAVMEEFLRGAGAASVIVVDNDGRFEETLARLTNLLNEESCSSSS